MVSAEEWNVRHVAEMDKISELMLHAALKIERSKRKSFFHHIHLFYKIAKLISIEDWRESFMLDWSAAIYCSVRCHCSRFTWCKKLRTVSGFSAEDIAPTAFAIAYTYEEMTISIEDDAAQETETSAMSSAPAA